MKKQAIIFLSIILVTLLGAGWYILRHQKTPTPLTSAVLVKPKKPNEQPPTGTVFYSCYDKKSITADYKEGTSTFPVNGSVHLILSDGREIILQQTKGDKGSRYANADQSFVYWGKGDKALVLEKNTNVSYANCVRVLESPAGVALPLVYSHSNRDFSLRLPAGYATDDSYKYQAFGLGKDIDGVKFTIPGSLAKGTNLSRDSYISVEEIPNLQNCPADRFLSDAVNIKTLNKNGTAYSVASSTGVVAGNRYEETIYAIAGNPCIAVRYFIHYGVMENYSAGVVREFNKPALLKQFDAIRHTLLIAQ